MFSQEEWNVWIRILRDFGQSLHWEGRGKQVSLISFLLRTYFVVIFYITVINNKIHTEIWSLYWAGLEKMFVVENIHLKTKVWTHLTTHLIFDLKGIVAITDRKKKENLLTIYKPLCISLFCWKDILKKAKN